MKFGQAGRNLDVEPTVRDESERWMTASAPPSPRSAR